MKSFNLIDKEWIPCLFLNGESRNLSLRETLADGANIRELYSPSPLITASIQRLLQAVLWRVFRIEGLTDWKALWRAGAFDATLLDLYLDQWHERFDLLHPERPFYQMSRLNLAKRTPLKRIGWEFAAGNNGTLFDHSSDDDRPVIDPADAARWVTATQCFAASAGRGELGQLHTKDSPWSRGAVIFLLGDNLFQTLSLNLLGLIREDFGQTEDDIPVWEKREDWEPAYDLTPAGILEYLTWQSRAIRLLPDENGDLRECYLAQGRSLREDFKREPAYAYEKDVKLGLRTWQFNEGRVWWRDSHTLLNLAADAPFLLPKSLHHLGGMVRENIVDRKHLYQLQVLGQSLEAGQPIIRFWRNERLPISPDYLNEKSLLDKLREAIKLSEAYADVLMESSYNLARCLIEFTSGRQPDKKDVRDMVKHWQPDSIYWSQLEAPFKKLLISLPTDRSDPDEYDEYEYGRQAMPEWASTLSRATRSAFLNAAKSLDGSSRGLKALAIAERSFNAKMNKLSAGINQQSQ